MNALRVLLIALVIALPIHAQVNTHWTFEEHQLEIAEGGRMNSVAISPLNSNEMFVASETGGLFKSTDGGRHWRHIDKLPVIFTQSVVYLQSGAVAVSSKADFRKTNGGGVWRSENGEDNWVQVLTDVRPGQRMNAYEISVQQSTGYVYVGTSQGLFKSENDGASFEETNLRGDRVVISVLAGDDRIYTAGPSGVRTWAGNGTLDLPTLGPVYEMHAFGLWREQNKAFFVNSAGKLSFNTVTAGWVSILSAPPAGRCDGTPFIKVVQRPALDEIHQNLHLYFSDRCGFYTFVQPIGPIMPFTGQWQLEDVDEDEPRDLAFNNITEPSLLGTTAGLHRRLNGGTQWRLLGGGKEGGYNAQQINEVRGQFLGQNALADLYIGMQDTRLRAWNQHNDDLFALGSEGHFIELPRHAEHSSDCKMAFVTDEKRKTADRLLANDTEWPDAPGEDGAPAMIREGNYVQQVKESTFSDGLALTRDCGRRWEPFAAFTEEPLDIPRLGRAGNPNDTTSLDVVYQPYKSTGGRNLLMRIERPAFALGDATPIYPLMTNFGSIGINPTMFAWYQVYAADSGDPMHLIAADVATGVMQQSTDGGREWTVMADLTDKVLSTEFNFRAALNGPTVGEIFSIVTAVSFSPTNPQLVLAGTSQAGIFASNDGGATWMKIPDSERVSNVTSFYWETNNRVFVSTYGRGLWLLRNRHIVAPFEDYCSSCDVVLNGSAPFHGSALVFDGHVLGVRTDKGRLQEIFVSPGSSVIFTGDLNDLQEDITFTPSDGRDAEFEPLPKGPDGWVATGVLFADDDQFAGAAFAKMEMTLLPSPSGKPVKDTTPSPVKGNPYIRLAASASRGIATAEPQEVVQLSATDFVADEKYEVLVDDEPVKGTVTADKNGSFTTTITAPSQTGYHRVAVRMVGDATAIDSSMVLVRY